MDSPQAIIHMAAEEGVTLRRRIKEEPAVLITMAETLSRVFLAGGRLYIVGNGGSAADAQHIAAEFVGRFQRERDPLPAVALTTDTSILTALANDYNYGRVFERQVAALVRCKDILLAISTSGSSLNVLRACITARAQGAVVLAFTGDGGGDLKGLSDHCLVVPSITTARIQEAHIFAGHLLVELVESFMEQGGEYGQG